jgi:hypothetical protein
MVVHGNTHVRCLSVQELLGGKMSEIDYGQNFLFSSSAKTNKKQTTKQTNQRKESTIAIFPTAYIKGMTMTIVANNRHYFKMG